MCMGLSHDELNKHPTNFYGENLTSQMLRVVPHQNGQNFRVRQFHRGPFDGQKGIGAAALHGKDSRKPPHVFLLS